MTNSFYSVPIRVQNKCREVVSVIRRAKPRFTITRATRSDCGRVKRSNSCSIGCAKANVHALKWRREIRLARDGELNAQRPGHCAVVGAALLEVHDTYKA